MSAMLPPENTPPDHPPATGPSFTLAGCREGVRLMLPLLPGVIVFGVAFGAAAVAKGLGFIETVTMSALVYAGLSQMVALENWQAHWSISSLAALALLTAAINGRMILQGASLQTWLEPFPRPVNYGQLFFLTDANWLITERYRARGGHDLGVLVGAGIGFWVIWVLATIPGHLAGALVTDPRRFGLDLLMPIYFTAMMVPLWKGRVVVLPWLVAGAVALVSSHLIGGYSFVILGALSGALAGALAGDGSEP